MLAWNEEKTQRNESNIILKALENNHDNSQNKQIGENSQKGLNMLK